MPLSKVGVAGETAFSTLYDTGGLLQGFEGVNGSGSEVRAMWS